MEQRQLNVLRMSRGEVAHLDGAPGVWSTRPVLVAVVNVVKVLTNGIVQAGLTQQEMVTGGYTLDKDQQLALMGAVTEPLIRGLRPLARMTSDNALLKQVDFAPSELVAGPEQEIVNRCQLIHDAAKVRETALADYGVTPTMISGSKWRSTRSGRWPGCATPWVPSGRPRPPRCPIFSTSSAISSRCSMT